MRTCASSFVSVIALDLQLIFTDHVQRCIIEIRVIIEAMAEVIDRLQMAEHGSGFAMIIFCLVQTGDSINRFFRFCWASSFRIDLVSINLSSNT